MRDSRKRSVLSEALTIIIVLGAGEHEIRQVIISFLGLLQFKFPFPRSHHPISHLIPLYYQCPQKKPFRPHPGLFVRKNISQTEPFIFFLSPIFSFVHFSFTHRVPHGWWAVRQIRRREGVVVFETLTPHTNERSLS